MKRTVLLIVALLIIALLPAATLQAQTRLAQGDLIYYEVDGPDAATVASYTAHLRDSGVLVTPSLPILGCSQVAALPTYTCRAAIPAVLAPGNHLLTITILAPGCAEAPPSNSFSVTIGLPLSPQAHNLRSTPQ